MTVYAIVNDIIGVSETGHADVPVWSIISPSGILQGGNPYFVPDFAGLFEARLALALRIGRLGKGIAPRFAYRYVDAVAPAVLFIATDLLDFLRREGLPWTQAISYDRCLALGRFETLPFEEIPAARVRLDIADKEKVHCSDCSQTFEGMDAAAIIHGLSRDNTLKTGDIILASVASSGPRATPGLSASLTLNGTDSLRFNVR